MPTLPSADAAHKLIESADFVWHQRFELAPGVHTPGANDIVWLLDAAGVPDDLSGVSAIDLGTTNGGTAFELERRGAERVVAVDIRPPEHYGFARLSEFLGSSVEWVQASLYEVAAVLAEQFDLVLCFGVLYHLRHPLLALDNVHGLLGGEALIETVVLDAEMPQLSAAPVARFYRGSGLEDDASNWFAPSLAGLLDWCASSGLDPELVAAWPADQPPRRAVVRARRAPGAPEWSSLSYELPVDARVLHRS
ncbi:MAG: tRNA (mo5U34)-methyltransferase [Actinomycetota bacterium]|nr:tRNA (mo5U34)-methyltransferase [Actinomycetota bacterium]